MNIFYVSMATTNVPVLRSSQIWDINLRQSLVSMGHHVIVPSFDPGQAFFECAYRPAGVDPETSRARYSEQMVQDVRAALHRGPVDLFFGYFYSSTVLPDAIDEIRALGIPTVNFYCNAVHQFDLVAEIAPHFDYCMVPEREALPKYRAVGANPVYIQMAANPDMYRPYDVPMTYDVTFVGQRYLNRRQYVGYLYCAGVNIRVWGPRWLWPPAQSRPSTFRSFARRGRDGARYLKRRLRVRLKAIQSLSEEELSLPPWRCGSPLPDEELVKMYSRSKISLGFSDVDARDENGRYKRQIHLRDFEAPMSGACYFTGYQDELAEFYEIGKEIICYDTSEELLDKVRYYLKHPDEAKKVREAGLRRARQDHTWENRFQRLFAVMGIG